jgi:hypothetical protein
VGGKRAELFANRFEGDDGAAVSVGAQGGGELALIGADVEDAVDGVAVEDGVQERGLYLLGGGGREMGVKAHEPGAGEEFLENGR